MTAAELITALLAFPSDIRIVVAGYEGGWSDVRSAVAKRARLDWNVDEPWYGPHANAEHYGKADDCSVPVVLLKSGRDGE